MSSPKTVSRSRSQLWPVVNEQEEEEEEFYDENNSKLRAHRYVQFVSLDTHPANNALVVTYEILVSVVERSSQRELSRRSKRDQFQIHISTLDRLKDAPDKVVIDLKELSKQILNKCSLLKTTGYENLEDIQLHLLYLIKRRQAHLLATANNEGETTTISRPASSRTLRSAGSAAGRSRFSATGETRSSRSKEQAKVSPDVYSHLETKERAKSLHEGNETNELLDYLEEFDQHLTAAMSESQAVSITRTLAYSLPAKISELDTYLEGLYGELNERLAAMASIRDLCNSDSNLIAASSNRLLICAMLRTLRDSGAKDQLVCESILYCLIRFTSFDNVHEQLFVQDNSSPGDSINLSGIVAELLASQVKVLKSLDDGQVEFLNDRYYYMNSLFVIILNLIELYQKEGNNYFENKIYSQQQQQQQDKYLTSLLADLIQICASRLCEKDLNLISKLERIINLLGHCVTIIRHLSIFKEFIVQLRQQRTFVTSLVLLTNALQLSRSGSGSGFFDGLNDGEFSGSKQLENELYELEINLLDLANNLMLDHHLRSRLIKKNFLKCVLRSLVIYLASNRRPNSLLKPYDRSSVLLVPLKGLYELGCDESVRCELYKSKIIMKCLFEFLLSAAIDIKHSIASSHGSQTDLSNRIECTSGEQVFLEAKCASHYILSIWVNLSARHEAPIYGDDPELRGLLFEYIDLFVGTLRAYLSKLSLGNTKSASERKSTKLAHKEQLLMIYLHLKLLRNLSQFMKPSSEAKSDELAKIEEWIEHIGAATSELLIAQLGANCQCLTPLAVECLTTLNNLIGKGFGRHEIEPADQQSISDIKAPPVQPQAPSEAIASLLVRLFQLWQGSANELFEPADNDDLLLVSINFLSILARNYEICNQLQTIKFSKILSAINFVLESRSSDREIIISSLSASAHLMRHKNFLSSIRAESFSGAAAANDDTADSGDEDERLALSSLVDRLAMLALHGDGLVSQLAIELLNTFKQVEEQATSCKQEKGQQPSLLVYEKRFACYNGKWLATIAAGSGANQQQRVASSKTANSTTSFHAYDNTDYDQCHYENAARDEMIDGCSEDYEQPVVSCLPDKMLDLLGDSDALEGADDFDSNDTDDSTGGSSNSSHQKPTASRAVGVILKPNVGASAQQDSDDLDSDSGSLEAPDLNVIDANSMIKHLTTRRQFRAEWELGR